MKINKVKETVKQLLLKYPDLRDSDEKLIPAVWFLETDKDDKMTAKEFLSRMWEKEYSKAESIRRARQKLQQDHPELRGSSYKNRQSVQVEETRQELGYPG